MMRKSIFFLLLTAALSACSTKMESLNNFNVDETFADLSITNLNTKYYSVHRLQTTITAPIADNYETVDQPYMEFPKGVDVIFYDEHLKEQSRMTADYAVYYSKKKLWEARKNVVIKNEMGTSLRTEQLFGDEVRKKIFSVKKSTVVDPDGTLIVGKQGFESDMSFRNYKFLDVNGVVNMQNQYGDDLKMTQN